MAVDKLQTMILEGRKRRPKTIETPELFEEFANEYFTTCHECGGRATLSGLMLSMGLVDHTFKNYERNPEFRDVCFWARSMVKGSYEGALYSAHSQGPQFALRAMFGVSDKREVEISGNPDRPVRVQTELDIKGAVRREMLAAMKAEDEEEEEEYTPGMNASTEGDTYP